jgi:hypothetical protein
MVCIDRRSRFYQARDENPLSELRDSIDSLSSGYISLLEKISSTGLENLLSRDLYLLNCYLTRSRMGSLFLLDRYRSETGRPHASEKIIEKNFTRLLGLVNDENYRRLKSADF